MNMLIKHLQYLIGKAFADVPDFWEKVKVEFEKLENAKSFWSEVYVAKLESDLVEVPKEVFIKIPRPTENVGRVETIDKDTIMQVLRNYVKRESNFYKLLNNREIPHFPTSHIYHIEKILGDGTGGMVAESLVGQVHAIDFLPGLNDEQVLRLIEALAGFHSFSKKMFTEKDFALFSEGVIYRKTAADIVRVLTLGTSRKERKANTERYLKHYYTTLERLSEHGNAPFSFEELKEQYTMIFPIVSNFTLFGIGVYYKMYSDGSLGKQEMKEENLKELLDRAEGIVEDIENSIV